MKKLFALLLVLVMVFSLAACGGDKKDESAKKSETPTEAPVQDVTIGDYYVKYDHAVLYKPYESDLNPATLVVYFDFTNNADEAYIPNTRVYVPAYQNETLISEIGYYDEYNPVECDNYEKIKCEPGQTVKCAVIFSYTEDAGNVEVTFMDNFHTIEDKLTVTINLDELELITTPLGVTE